MDLNNKIEYYQRLGHKTEIRTVIKKGILIRVKSETDLKDFVESLESYGRENRIKFSTVGLLAETEFPFQFRIVHQEMINSFYTLIYRAISENLYMDMILKNTAINSYDIHFEESYA